MYLKHTIFDNDRFFSKIAIGDNEDDCWEWTAAVRSNGYGVFLYNGKLWAAHRFMYDRAVGPIPDGLFVCHRCDNRLCVNPAHLFLGTPKENLADMTAKGRRKSPSFKGEENNTAKLTADEVREIRALHASGISGAALGRRYGVSKVNISDIVRRRTWRHIE